jgi:hypothetical protein
MDPILPAEAEEINDAIESLKSLYAKSDDMPIAMAYKRF